MFFIVILNSFFISNSSNRIYLNDFKNREKGSLFIAKIKDLFAKKNFIQHTKNSRENIFFI